MAKILIIDDEPDHVLLVKLTLGREGHETYGASGCAEALEKLEKLRPDLILLDFMMPELDGWATLARIRERDELKDVPVAMLTAKILTHDMLTGEEVGDLVDYIEKPSTGGALVARVNAILEGIERIRVKKSLLKDAGVDHALREEFEFVSMAETLHKNILNTLQKMMAKEKKAEMIAELEDRIVSQRKKVDGFVKRREKFEARFDERVIKESDDAC